MGSKSDWDVMRHTHETLDQFGVPHECSVLSAHRTPRQTADYVSQAEARGLEVIIAAAGGAAHLAGVAAAHTLLPVLGVPMESAALKGLDSLLAMVQMRAASRWGRSRSASRARSTRRCWPSPSSPTSGPPCARSSPPIAPNRPRKFCRRNWFEPGARGAR